MEEVLAGLTVSLASFAFSVSVGRPSLSFSTAASVPVYPVDMASHICDEGSFRFDGLILIHNGIKVK